MKLEKLIFPEIHFDRMEFADRKDFEEYMNRQWDLDPVKSVRDEVNDRFEMILHNSANLRHDVRTGVKQTNETIDVTMYEWIQRFMARTKKELTVEGVEVAGQVGRAVFNLYEKTLRFEEKEEMMSYPFIHLCLRVEDLEKSVAFYREALGYEEVRRDDYPEDKFTLVFLEDPKTGFQLELTYNYGHGPYVIGDGYSHFAVTVEDTMASFEKHKKMGVTTGDRPSSTPSGGKSLYFIKDPDGYRVEIIGKLVQE